MVDAGSESEVIVPLWCVSVTAVVEWHVINFHHCQKWWQVCARSKWFSRLTVGLIVSWRFVWAFHYVKGCVYLLENAIEVFYIPYSAVCKSLK